MQNRPRVPGTITHEQIKAFIETAHALKEKGATEENNPEFARIVSLLRYYSQQSQAMKQKEVPETPKLDVNTLKTQIEAWKQLAANKPIPEVLQSKLFGNSNNSAPSPSLGDPMPSKIVDVTFAQEKQKQPTQDPYEFLSKARPGTKDVLQRLVIPSIMPTAPDPNDLLKERRRMINARLQQRIKELESLPSNLNNDDSIKIKALIELKALKLADKQKKLRMDLLSSISKATTLSTAVDRSAFRRMKRQSLREARQTEKQERSNRAERDKKERQKHLDYLSHILTHGRDMMAFHRNQGAKVARLGMAVQRYHANAAKEEEKRLQQISENRLKALKENDEEAYLKLIDKTKDKRITHLLNQTASFLTTLTNAVNLQKQATGEVEIPLATVSNEPRDEEEEILDYYNTAHRIKEEVKQQSTLLVGGTLKEYQIKGLEWMVSLYNNRLNGILADEMGLGKTIQTISLITYLIEKKKQPGPFLVIVPLSTMTNWVLEFEKWAPSVVKVVYKGGPVERKNSAALVKAGNFNVLLTTYEYIIRDRPVLSKVKWIHMIIDEGHRMKNNNSKLAVTLMQYYHTRYRIILTGTPLQNNLPELWALLNFILPKIFNSVKSFDEWFNQPFARESGQEKIDLNEEEQLLIIRRLHKVLRPFLLRRLKKDVEKDLPDKVETIIKCPMSALQHRLYEQIRNRKAHFGAEGAARKKVLNNLVMQFRKICNHPYVFDEVEDSINPARLTDRNLFRVAGKFELLDRILPKFKAAGHRVLIFFQMTQVMNIMEDYLRWKDLTYLRLDGQTKADDRTAMLKVFNASENPPFCFLLSTRAGGLGLNLQVADTVIIFDSDWNPHQDLQAQDRAHRIGQTKEVRILRLITSKSIEENILARAQYKLDMDGKVIQAGKFDNKTTDSEREDLLRALFGNDDEDEDEKGENENLEDSELNEIISRNDEELVLYNKMDEERRKQEQLEWENSGGQGPVPPRLMEESELPVIYIEDPEIKEELPIEYGRGGRSRKNVVYDDGLNDNQFLAALDEGDVDGFIEKTRKNKLKREQSKLKRKQENGGVSEDSNGEIEENFNHSDADSQSSRDMVARSGRKGRGRKSSGIISEQSVDDLNSDLSHTKKTRKAKTFAGVDPDAPETLDPATRQALTRVANACFKAVEEAEVDDGDGYDVFVLRYSYSRRRSELFLTLPDKIDYHDYYLLIKNPIAMDMISHRIASTYYKSLDEFIADFNLMFENAMTYNEDGSMVYEDASQLKNIFMSCIERLAPGGQLKITEADREFANRAQLESRKRGRDASESGGLKVRLNLGAKKTKIEDDD